jgi:hypothetical protein
LAHFTAARLRPLDSFAPSIVAHGGTPEHAAKGAMYLVRVTQIDLHLGVLGVKMEKIKMRHLVVTFR